jgi:hypothetical protein
MRERHGKGGGIRRAAVYRVIEISATVHRIVYDTRLDRFLDDRDIPSAVLADTAGYSRQYLLGLRSGAIEPTRKRIQVLTAACIVIADDPRITPDDLFEIVPGAAEIAEARARFEATNGVLRRQDLRATGRTVRRRQR